MPGSSPYPQGTPDDQFLQSDMTLAASQATPDLKSSDEKRYSMSEIGSASSAEETYPDGGLRAWLIVFGVGFSAKFHEFFDD